MKILKFPGMACLAACLVVLLCLCAACTSGSSGQVQPAQTTAPAGGIAEVTVNTSSGQPVYTLQDAQASVIQDYLSLSGNATGYSIFYIRGDHVDSSGNAQRWIFGIRGGNVSSMMVYDANGIATLALPPNMPIGQGIPADLPSPADILKIASSSPNAASLNLYNGNASLQIMNGEYIVSGSGPTSQQIVINASTGELSAANA